jgi:MFS family permease
MANPYRELFSAPGALGLVITSAIARLPQAMIGIGIITMLVQQTGLYWLAGAVAGTYTVVAALIGPQISKLVDRHGQRRVLPPLAAFSIGMLIALIIAVYLSAPATLLFILAALAGTMPSMPAMIRARWMQLFRGKPLLHTAFSVDTVITELAFVIGPPLAIGLSVSFFPQAGPLVAVLLQLVGVTAFLMQRQTEPKVVVSTGKRAGSTLMIPGVPTIVLALLAMGIIGGSVDVAVVAFANAQGWPASASFILAAYALGSLIAGLTFGALKIPVPIDQQFFIGALVMAITAALPILSPDVYILCAMLFVAGMSFAPTMVIIMNLGTMIVPPSRITEGFTWMSTGVSIGVALGGVLAGLVTDAYGAQAGFGVAIVAGLIMVLIVLNGLRTLRASSATGHEITYH